MASNQEARIRDLEQRVSALWWLTIAQTVMIGVLATAYLLPFGPAVVAIPVIALPLLVFGRRYLPGWARRVGRFVASTTLRNASSSPKGN